MIFMNYYTKVCSCYIYFRLKMLDFRLLDKVMNEFLKFLIEDHHIFQIGKLFNLFSTNLFCLHEFQVLEFFSNSLNLPRVFMEFNWLAIFILNFIASMKTVAVYFTAFLNHKDFAIMKHFVEHWKVYYYFVILYHKFLLFFFISFLNLYELYHQFLFKDFIIYVNLYFIQFTLVQSIIQSKYLLFYFDFIFNFDI